MPIISNQHLFHSKNLNNLNAPLISIFSVVGIKTPKTICFIYLCSTSFCLRNNFVLCFFKTVKIPVMNFLSIVFQPIHNKNNHIHIPFFFAILNQNISYNKKISIPKIIESNSNIPKIKSCGFLFRNYLSKSILSKIGKTSTTNCIHF